MELKSINDGNFDSKLSSKDAENLVFFWAPWSKPCEPFQETLADLAKTYDGKLEIFCMNIDENANMPATLGVKTIPQLSYIENGVISASLSGRQAKVKIREFLESVVSHGKEGR